MRPSGGQDVSRESANSGDLHDGEFEMVGFVTFPANRVAERAQKSLSPALPHAALVLVTPDSPVLSVQVAAPQWASQWLSAVDWTRLVGKPLLDEGGAARLDLPPVLDGLRVAGWVARAAGYTTAMVVGDRSDLPVSASQEKAAMRVVMGAAAQMHAIDNYPPPGTLAFLRALSQERERLRLEMRTRHAMTLSSLLHALRDATRTSSAQMSPSGVNRAIDIASQALLDLRGGDNVGGVRDRMALGEIFSETQQELCATLQAARIRMVADLRETAAHVAPAIVHAARLVTRSAVLNAMEHAGADRLRLLWRVTDEELVILVADNGEGADLGADQRERELVDIRRMAGELRGQVDLDFHRRWGTTMTCSLPLHDRRCLRENPAARRLSELRDRECEVLTLITAGLRNRDIAARLFISERTVKFHVSNVLTKLQVGSRAEAIALAHRAGISMVPSVA